MNATVVPASDAVFNVTSEEPKNDDDWMAVQNQAIVLTESGNLLMLGDRAPDSGDWIRFSQAFIDASRATVKEPNQQMSTRSRWRATSCSKPARSVTTSTWHSFRIETSHAGPINRPCGVANKQTRGIPQCPDYDLLR
jgi:hypothetical protein